MRIIGLNCLGIINTNQGVALSANEALETPQLLAGHISLLSQSGSLLGSLLSRGQSRRLRFAKMVSVGNEADLGIGEIGELLIEDPDTDAILLFLETIRSGQRFSEMARRAFQAKKPAIAYLLGRSAIGNQLAASHTGAIAGNSAAIEAFLRENGVIRVDMLETLIEMAPFVIGRQPTDRGRVNVMGTTGGGGALMVDNLGMRAVTAAPPGSAVGAAREFHGGGQRSEGDAIGGQPPDHHLGSISGH
jgi:acyl-CoA synthetase (NDP forming)